MYGKDVPQSVNQVVLSRDELYDVGRMITMGQTEPLELYDDIIIDVDNPTAYRLNYLELRFEGFSHREALDLSLELDKQFSSKDRRGRLSDHDSKEFHDYTWTYISYGEYLTIGAINGELLARLLKSGGDISEVKKIQANISEAHPNLTRLQRHDILSKFIELRTKEDEPLDHEAAKAEAISSTPLD